MKAKSIKQITALILAAAVPVFFTACNEEDHNHDHGDGEAHEHHDGDGHAPGTEGHEEEGDGHGDHDHAEGGHEHADAKAVRPVGPNGGRIITDVEPHIEFFVTEDRKIKVTSLNEDNKPSGTAPAFTLTLTGGDRSNPTRLAFAADGTSLISEGTLPDGKMIPVVLQFKTGDDKPTMTKFNVDLNNCPTCDYLEYACTCAHAGDHGHDHAHDDHDHKH